MGKKKFKCSFKCSLVRSPRMWGAVFAACPFSVPPPQRGRSSVHVWPIQRSLSSARHSSGALCAPPASSADKARAELAAQPALHCPEQELSFPEAPATGEAGPGAATWAAPWAANPGAVTSAQWKHTSTAYNVKKILALLPTAPGEQERQGWCVLLCVHVLCSKVSTLLGGTLTARLTYSSFKIAHSKLSSI